MHLFFVDFVCIQTITWTSCDDYKSTQLECHPTVESDATSNVDKVKLTLDKESGSLRIINTENNEILWQRGKNSQILAVKQPDGIDIGFVSLVTETEQVTWTTNHDFYVNELDKSKWTLLFSHDCTKLEYFTPELVELSGFETDRLYSRLRALSDPEYQVYNVLY